MVIPDVNGRDIAVERSLAWPCERRPVGGAILRNVVSTDISIVQTAEVKEQIRISTFDSLENQRIRSNRRVGTNRNSEVVRGLTAPIPFCRLS